MVCTGIWDTIPPFYHLGTSESQFVANWFEFWCVHVFRLLALLWLGWPSFFCWHLFWLLVRLLLASCTLCTTLPAIWVFPCHLETGFSHNLSLPWELCWVCSLDPPVLCATVPFSKKLEGKSVMERAVSTVWDWDKHGSCLEQKQDSYAVWATVQCLVPCFSTWSLTPTTM